MAGQREAHTAARTHERYETGRKGLELKTSDSRNRCSRSHDIGLRGGAGAGAGDFGDSERDGDGWRAAVPHLARNRGSGRRRRAAVHGWENTRRAEERRLAWEQGRESADEGTDW